MIMARPHRNGKRRGVRPGNWANWQLCELLGKFGQEGLLVQYLYDLTMEGMGEPYSFGDGGSNDTVLAGPFGMSGLSRYRGHIDYGDAVRLNRSEKRFAKQACGAILHEDSNGFCSAVWFPNTPDGQKKFAEAQDRLADFYYEPDDDYADEVGVDWGDEA
jgi:hypothetical protein